MKVQLSQRASGGWRPAWNVAAWLRVIILSLICACAGLIWSSGTASADTGHRSNAPLVTGIRSLGRSLGSTANSVLGAHTATRPPATRQAHRQPAVKPVDRAAPARAAEAVTSPDVPKPHPLIKHPLIKHPLMRQHPVEQPRISAHQRHSKISTHTDDARTLIHGVTGTVGHTVHSTAGSVHGVSSRVGSTADPVERAGHRLRERSRSDDLAASVGGTVHSVGDVVHNVGRTTDRVGSAADGTAGIVDGVARPDRLGAATGEEIDRVSGVVRATDEVVGSTGAVVGSTGGTIGSLGGDRSRPVGNVVGDLGDTVTSLGGTVDGLGQTADDLDTTVGNTASGAVTRTIDHTIGGTTVSTVTDTLTTTVTGTVGDTVTGVGKLADVTTGDTTLLRPVAPTVQPYGQRDTGSLPAEAADPLRHTTTLPGSASARHPAVDFPHSRTPASTLLTSAPLITLLTAAPEDATPAGHVRSAQRSTQPAAMSGTLLLGLAGGPGPRPGQSPQPAGEMITAPASGGTWHEHAVLRAAINGTTAEPADIEGSSSALPHVTPYDPGYSPD